MTRAAAAPARPSRAGPTQTRRGRMLACQWTRTQRIRTAAEIPVEAVIADRAEVPVYLRIAEKAKHLRELGVSDRAIARALGVSDKTVAKAILRSS